MERTTYPQTEPRYRWAITLTRRRADEPNTVFETYKVARTPDQLCDIVLHSSLDPTVVAYSYHRYEDPEPTTPAICTTCEEPFDVTRPHQTWSPCGRGGSITYTCRVCGAEQTRTLQYA